MLDFLSLPPELIEKITDQLEGTYKKTLRLTCTQLNAIVEHQLFANIVIKYSNYQPDLICAQLEALAERTTTARRHARSLEIRGFSPDSHLGARSRSRSVERSRGSRSRSRGPLAEAHQSNRGILTYLGQAISSLSKVQEVWWHIGINDPEWAQIVVMDSLVSLPFLKVLRISLGGAPAPSLKLEQLTDMHQITITGYCADYRTDIVAGLRTLISNSPQLTHLDVGFKGRANGSDLSTLHDILGAVPPTSPLALSHLTLQNWGVRLDPTTLPHLHALHTLSLHDNVDTRSSPPVDLDAPAIAALVARTAACCASYDEIWDALRQERIWLREIATDGVTAAFLDYLAAYSGLQKLRLSSAPANDGLASDTLAMQFYQAVLPRHADSLAALEITPEYEGKWCFGRHNCASLLQCANLETLKIHINSAEIDRAKKQDVVWTLLGIADDLPHLAHLTIASADSESNRGGRSGNPSIGHIYRVNKEITESVTTFGPLDTSATSKVITTPARDYVARSDENAGEGLWYRSSMSGGSRLEL
ncbi:hypothetical protein BJ912DRAFT_876190 [Pholiota molesta]|nr:hypothetical protein BJ912DRAFT_876190 [Pholiota molesta]